MAQRFWNVYVAIRDKGDLRQEDWDPFITHVRWELRAKASGYGHPINENTEEELLHHIITSVVDGVAKANFDPNRNTFKNWVDGVVRNIVRNYLRLRATPRGQEKSLDALLEIDGEWASASTESPDQVLLDDEAAMMLLTTLRRVQQQYPQYYEVLRLRCFYNLSTEETASYLNDDNANISRRLHRARVKLREMLEIEGGNHDGR